MGAFPEVATPDDGSGLGVPPTPVFSRPKIVRDGTLAVRAVLSKTTDRCPRPLSPNAVAARHR